MVEVSDGRGPISHAAGSFYAHRLADRLYHDIDDLGCCRAVAETGRRFDEIGTGRLGDFACLGNLLGRKIAAFQNDLHQHLVRLGLGHHGLDVLLYVIEIAGKELADVHYHVDLGGTVFDTKLGLKGLDLGAVAAVGKSDDYGGSHAGTFELFGGQSHVGGTNAQAGHLTLGTHLAPVDNVLVRGKRFENRMVQCGRYFFGCIHVV